MAKRALSIGGKFILLLIIGCAAGYWVLKVNNSLSALGLSGDADPQSDGIQLLIFDSCEALTYVDARVELTTDPPLFRLRVLGKPELDNCDQTAVSVRVQLNGNSLRLGEFDYHGLSIDGKPLNVLFAKEKLLEIEKTTTFGLTPPTFVKDYHFDLTDHLSTGFGEKSVSLSIQGNTSTCISSRKENASQYVRNLRCRYPAYASVEFPAHKYDIDAIYPPNYQPGKGEGTIVVWRSRPASPTSSFPGAVTSGQIRLVERQVRAVATSITIIGSAVIGAVISVLAAMIGTVAQDVVLARNYATKAAELEVAEQSLNQLGEDLRFEKERSSQLAADLTAAQEQVQPAASDDLDRGGAK